MLRLGVVCTDSRCHTTGSWLRVLVVYGQAVANSKTAPSRLPEEGAVAATDASNGNVDRVSVHVLSSVVSELQQSAIHKAAMSDAEASQELCFNRELHAAYFKMHLKRRGNGWALRSLTAAVIAVSPKR